MQGLIILQLLVHRQHSHSVQQDPDVPVIPAVILHRVTLGFEAVETVHAPWPAGGRCSQLNHFTYTGLLVFTTTPASDISNRKEHY